MNYSDLNDYKKIINQYKNMNGKRLKIATVENSNAVFKFPENYQKSLFLEKYQEKNNFASRKNSCEIF